MAMTTGGSTGSYYEGVGPDIPAAGGDYGAPTPHARHADQDPFVAPTSMPEGGSMPASSAGFDAIDGLGGATQL